MPRRRKPPETVTIDGLATMSGLKPGTVQKAHGQARTEYEASGKWPAHGIPQPVSGKPLTWIVDARLKAWARKQAPRDVRPPELDDRAWLLAQYGHPDGLDGRPVVEGGLARSLREIGASLGVNAVTVGNQLLTFGVMPPKADMGPLADVSLEAMEEALEGRTVEQAAAHFGVSHMTFRRALKAKRTARDAAVDA